MHFRLSTGGAFFIDSMYSIFLVFEQLENQLWTSHKNSIISDDSKKRSYGKIKKR